MTSSYDYIIAGAGCAGLSLAMRMVHSGQLHGKSMLLIDQNPKNVNDRTWCFWEQEAGFFEHLVYKQWSNLRFYDDTGHVDLDINPYQYKLIKGIDFYNFCLNVIASHSNITLLQQKVEDVVSGDETFVIAGGQKYYSEYVFNSIWSKPKLNKGDYWLLQHFKGWYIKADRDAFDPGVATLMDFSRSQEHGTAFFYVLPFSTTEALVEYTLFSSDLLDDGDYDAALEQYIRNNLNIDSYAITEREFGVIPMTNARFEPSRGNVINIGTAGGQTKGSSGYTFQFIQKRSEQIVANLQHGRHPAMHQTATRFEFYDSVLLDVLYNKRLPGRTVFSKMFRKNKASAILQFLDNDSSMADDVRIISSLPTIPFAKAAWRQLFK